MFYIDLPVGLGRKLGNKFSVYGGLTFSLRAFSVFDYSGKTLYKTPDSTYTTIIKERDYSNNAIDLADIAFSAGFRYQVSKKAAITANFSRDLLGIGISEENFITNKHANMWANIGVEFYLFKSKSLL
jgi:hypothetical protein